MSLSIGIVGLPNVGKSTLFKTLTKKEVLIANYPFATIDPNVGVVLVPDERIDKLGEFSNSVKKIYATVDFVDIAGLVKGASEGEGLGNKFLANIRETDAILYVLRAFKNADIVNTQTEVNPLADKEILDVELILKDLDKVNKRIDGLAGDVRAGKKDSIKESAVLTKAKEFLSQQKVLVDQEFTEDETEILKSFQLLTFKPRLYLLNGKTEEVTPEMTVGLKNYVVLGDKAPQAAGVIHSDFEQKFVKAEVIFWEDLLKAGSFAKARETGLIRTEGKEYVVKDGDVIEFKHG